jgi:phage tail sheath protein FI
MAEMILPGVYIEVRAEGLITPGRVTVGNVGVVGTAGKGPVGVPVLLGSFSEAQEKFGAYDPFVDGKSNELTLVRALELAFAHGATTVFALRVTSTETAAAGENFIEAWNRNTKARRAAFSLAGETAGTVSAVLKARTHGTWGNEITVNVFNAEEDSFIAGEKHDGPAPVTLDRTPVSSSLRNRVKVHVGATGQVRDLSIVYSPTAPAAGQVQINTATGALTFAAGEDPVAGDTVMASYAVPKADSCKVTLRSGGVTEIYTVADGRHLVDLLNAADSPSSLAEGTAGLHPDEKPKKNPDAGEFLKFGRGSDTPGSDGADAVDSDYKFGLDQLLHEDVHIMVAAGQDNEAIGDELAAHCDVASSDKIRRDRIAVVGSKVGATFDGIRGHRSDSPRVILVAPGIKAGDSAAGKEVTLPGSYTAAVVAGMLSAVDAHISLTNKPVAVGGLEARFTRPQLEQLVQARVCAMEEARGRGIRVVKGITTSTDTAWHQITTRRIVDFAKYGVRSAANPYIGRLNNERVRGAMKATINSFLQEMVDDEKLIGYELDVTATRDEEIKGIARVTLVLQPTFSIDFIKVTMFLA